MKTALTDRLGLDLPIVQAPMAGTSTPALAAAVSNAGALGSISIASVDAVEGQRQIQALKALTDVRDGFKPGPSGPGLRPALSAGRRSGELRQHRRR